MINPLPIGLVGFLLMSLASCDYSIYVGVRNYKAPCKVAVTYDKSHGIFYNNDTLHTVNLQNDTQRSWLIRENTSDTSYSFVAPTNFETGLNPVSLGTPVRQIQITNAADSVWTLPRWDDGSAIRKLKKSGHLEYKGFLIFKHTIIINNK